MTQLHLRTRVQVCILEDDGWQELNTYLLCALTCFLLFLADFLGALTARSAVKKRPKTARKDPHIAIVTMLGETSVESYNKFSVYQQLSSMTLQSMLDYGTRQGYPVFFLNDFLIDKSRQAYWSKINIIRHYLQMDFDYVLYTDIDVLFSNPEVPLSDFIVEGYDLIGVDECQDRVKTRNDIRSGFMLFKKSKGAMEILESWASLFSTFEHIENPEQEALQLLVSMPEFKDNVILHSWKNFHSYDTCNGGEGAFSMHFPGLYKIERVARMVAWLEMHGGNRAQAFTERGFAEMLGVGRSVRSMAHDILKKGLVSLKALPIPSSLELYDLDSFSISMEIAGYNVLQSNNAEEMKAFQEDTWRFDETAHLWAIPNVSY